MVERWVFVPFYARSPVFTMPEFLERRFSPASRYVLSIVSLVTFIVSKIAVGIFAGGVVFATLLPEINLHVGAVTIDSFCSGSVAVIILTGFYTIIGGMRTEFERLVPIMKTGGFIPSVDHQTPPGVSLDQYRIYLRLLDEYVVKGAASK